MATVQAIELTYNRLYLVESGGVRVLIDAGPDYAGAWDELQRHLAGKQPDIVIATHAHSDHAGLGRQWQEAGVPVWLHGDDHRVVASHPLHDEIELQGFERYLNTSGAPLELRAETLAGLRQRRQWAIDAATRDEHPPARPGSRWPTGLRMRPFVADPDHPAIGEAGLEIIHCPGHTPGNVVVVHREQGLLFSGDQLLPNITPTPGIQMRPLPGGGWERFRSLPAYVDSLRRLSTTDVERCFPGHGGEILNPLELVAENLRGIEERSARVLEAVQAEPEATVYAVSRAIYPKALERRFWQIVATVQGHLDLLTAEGTIRAGEDGVYRE